MVIHDVRNICVVDYRFFTPIFYDDMEKKENACMRKAKSFGHWVKDEESTARLVKKRPIDFHVTLPVSIHHRIALTYSQLSIKLLSLQHTSKLHLCPYMLKTTKIHIQIDTENMKVDFL